MHPPNPKLLRFASRALSLLSKGHASGFIENVQQRLGLLISQQHRFSRLSHRLQLCLEHSLVLASDRVLEELRWAGSDLLNDLVAFNDFLQQRPASLPGFREVYADLKQMEIEFGDFEHDGSALRVSTDPITLEDVNLGPFELQLRLDQLHQRDLGSILQVIALEPNPASADENITHPHVSGESLCSGDATAPIQSALRQGRLCDVFLLVRSVLQHYNPGSPYISLDDWFGVRCSDCGNSVSEDERYSCNRCGEELCSDCTALCTFCDSPYCNQHIRSCPTCDRCMCNDCFITCRVCGRRACPECITDELCPDCIEQQKENDHEEASESTADDHAVAK